MSRELAKERDGRLDNGGDKDDDQEDEKDTVR